MQQTCQSRRYSITNLVFEKIEPLQGGNVLQRTCQSRHSFVTNLVASKIEKPLTNFFVANKIELFATWYCHSTYVPMPLLHRHQSGSSQERERESTCKVVLTFNERAKATTPLSPIWFNVKREHLQRDMAIQCTGQSRCVTKSSCEDRALAK